MAIDDAYATAEQYREVTKAIDGSADSVILRDLAAVSRWLEMKLGRFFNVDAGDVTRIFEPEHPKRLAITDLTADPTTIKIDENDDGIFADETALASTDYELRPLNAGEGPVVEPFTEIWLTRWGTKSSWRNRRVEVVGKFGWLTVPELVVDATIEFTRMWRMETPRATTQIQEMESVIGMSRGASKMLHDLTETYWMKDGFA